MIEIRYSGDALWARIERAVEKVRDEYPEPVPTIDDFALIQNARTLPFESLVKMKLTSFRRKDQVHILDMISIGLLDETWPARFSPEWASV